jgi:hypothetical protein
MTKLLKKNPSISFSCFPSFFTTFIDINPCYLFCSQLHNISPIQPYPQVCHHLHHLWTKLGCNFVSLLFFLLNPLTTHLYCLITINPSIKSLIYQLTTNFLFHNIIFFVLKNLLLIWCILLAQLTFLFVLQLVN